MFGKAVLLICLATVAAAQTDAPKLPAGLSEPEARSIQKEQGVNGHVKAAIRVADARLLTAGKLADAGGYGDALTSLKLYGALLSYADAHARQLPPSAKKDRNKCLKELEQAIFKQQRPLEATRRELPFDYREQTDVLIETLKQLRLRALDDVLGDGKMIK